MIYAERERQGALARRSRRPFDSWLPGRGHNLDRLGLLCGARVKERQGKTYMRSERQGKTYMRSER